MRLRLSVGTKNTKGQHHSFEKSRTNFGQGHETRDRQVFIQNGSRSNEHFSVEKLTSTGLFRSSKTGQC